MAELIFGKLLSRLPTVLRDRSAKSGKVMIVADAAVASRHGKSLAAGLKKAGFVAGLTVIPSGERSKTLERAGVLYRALARSRFERKSTLIALGGGVVGDLTGFVAATFLRGIRLVQVPTTLLAQVDAAIGGKTAVDIPEGKNLVGAFYQPLFVLIDPELLKSLPPRHWRNGMAEVIKYGAIRDPRLFELLESRVDHLVKGYSPEWEPIIERCARIKTEIVRRDPVETKGLRALLNFGHSVGHAVEAAAGYQGYLHGEAIAIGMHAAAILSESLTGLRSVDCHRLVMLLDRAGLPVRARRPMARGRLMDFLSRDKKVQDGTVRFVLLKGLGRAVAGRRVSPKHLDRALEASGL
jgi:3-dehydroquinate synthase